MGDFWFSTINQLRERMFNTMQTYVAYLAFKAKERLSSLGSDERTRMVEEISRLFNNSAENELKTRGVYLTTGFRADTDFMIWWIAPTPQAIQAGIKALNQSELGRRIEASWSFVGLHRPAEFHHDHSPAFVQGIPPKETICVYPFTRTPEWYLLPSAERRELLTSHGQLGADFDDVLTNTTMGFGLGDDEWVLAFEADDLGRIVDMIRKLREAEARRYTSREIPFISGVRMSIEEVIHNL